MSEITQPDFVKFLEDGFARGGFETDDTLAILLPLMNQVLAVHEAGLVAPLDGIGDLRVSDQVYQSWEHAIGHHDANQ